MDVVRRSVAMVSLLVRDYDESIAFFSHALAFRVVKDTPLEHGKRWVVVAPPGGQGVALLLARAAGPEQKAHVGNQTGFRASETYRAPCDRQKIRRDFARSFAHFADDQKGTENCSRNMVAIRSPYWRMHP